MTATTPTTAGDTSGGTAGSRGVSARARRDTADVTIRPVPFHRLLDVELRKTLDTRAGAWLLASIALIACLVVGVFALWGNEDELDMQSFASTISFPMLLVLPMVAVLAVTSEWTQRSALTTFALVPRRGRVVGAKAAAALLVAVAASAVQLGASALGAVAAAAFRGLDARWDLPLDLALRLALLNVVAVAVGFAWAVLIRASAPALVAYLTFVLVLPMLSGIVAAVSDWYSEHSAWLDLSSTMLVLSAPSVSGEEWAQLGTAALLWVGVPLAVGLRRLVRVEIR
ncbi:hypothetical protein GCM10009809_00240 [Isoptericola hypogeus]|uniref:ABC-2 type transport system permease protein n=1 Tax=Isoptericola hypogeus TaxID=300179 RepID=A0ABN2IM93_9MICO